MYMDIHGVESITVQPVKVCGNYPQPNQWRDIEIITNQGTTTITLFSKESSKLSVTLLEG